MRRHSLRTPHNLSSDGAGQGTNRKS